MVAREVERAAGELRAFQLGAREHFGLASIAFVLALVASRFLPALALPLLAGGIGSLILGVRDEIRRWELIDRFVLDRDAYQIPAVRDRACRAATMRNRCSLAASARALLSREEFVCNERAGALTEELEMLAATLEDPTLTLDPLAAIACERLLTDVQGSPLRNPTMPVADAHACIVRIMAGFRPTGHHA
jgi:hypothetical protein